MSYFEDFLKEKEKIPIKIKPKIKSQLKDFNIKEFLSEIATSSEFERLLFKALYGKVFRGSTPELEENLESSIIEFRELNKE